jgi:pyridoxamine 5'-phosphate oxidase
MANLHAVPDTAPKEPFEISQRAWASLERGARDRRAGLHTLTLATTGSEGFPEARTIVLRHASGADRQIRFHTDSRAAKYREMVANPAVTILGYDAPSKLQLRMRGTAIIHKGDQIALEAWNASQPQSLMCYRQPEAPSLTVEGPLAAPDMRGITFQPLDGFENFAVISIAVETLEWLFLSRLGHQRIRFNYGNFATSHGSVQWLAP